MKLKHKLKEKERERGKRKGEKGGVGQGWKASHIFQKKTISYSYSEQRQREKHFQRMTQSVNGCLLL